MNLLLHEVRFGLIGVARNPRARVMTLAFPLILLVILVGISKGGTTTLDGSDVTLRRFFVAGILAMSLLVACYGSLVAVVVSQRETGVFKRRRATPTPSWVIVAGHALTTLIVAAATSAVLLLVARVLYGVGVSATGLGVIALSVIAGGLAFACIAYAVASVIPNVETAQPAVQLTMLPLYFISGIWFTTDELPNALQKVAEYLPVEPLAHQLHLALLDPHIDGSDLATLAVWAVAGVLIASRRFTWLPRAAVTA